MASNSVYADAATSMRDTTKWLIAFVPATALVLAGVGIVPGLVRPEGIDEQGLGWLALAALAIGAVVGFGAHVLTAQPAAFPQLARDYQDDATEERATSLIKRAELAGVFWFRYQSFEDALKALMGVWTGGAEDARLTALAEDLRGFELFEVTRTRFVRFVRVFIVGVLVLAIGGLGAYERASDLAASDVFDAPTAVAIVLTEGGATAFRDATSCTAPDDTTFLAVEGTWDAPVLAVSGPDCASDARWSATDADLDGPVVPVPVP